MGSRNKPYDENLPVIDEPLPALTPGSVEIPGADERFYQDLYNDADQDVPQEVADDVASAPAEQTPPEIPETGMRFDFGSLNVQTKEDFAALPDEQKELLRAMKRGVQFTPAAAADFVLKQRSARMQQDQKMAAMQADPLRQAQVSDRNAKLVERQAVQNDFKIRRQNTIKNIEEILADNDYSSLVGPFDGTVGSVYDAAFNEKMQAKRAKLDRLINIDVLDMTKYLRPISQDELKYLRTLVPGQRQNWEVYKQYLGEKLDMLKATDRAVVNPATNQPLPNDEGQSAPQPQQNVYQQSQQNPAAQLRQQFEQSDELTLPNGQKLKRVVDANGNIGWEPQ